MGFRAVRPVRSPGAAALLISDGCLRSGRATRLNVEKRHVLVRCECPAAPMPAEEIHDHHRVKQPFRSVMSGISLAPTGITALS
jgi:hypothetical protein